MESDLSGIPVPTVFQEKSREETEERIISRLKSLRPDTYANRLQPSDPAVSVVKSVSAELSEFRSYANEIARTQFVAWYKDQQRTRRRFGFGEEYKNRALEISLQLSDEMEAEEKLARKSKDVLVDSDREGRVILWVLSEAKNGEAHRDLTAKIEEILNREDQKIKTDTIVARSAIGKPFQMEAKIWLYPTTPIEVFQGLRQRFIDAFAVFRAFEKDVNPSWISSVLHIAGVQNVDLSGTEPLRVGKNECAWLESVDISLEGRKI